MARPVTLFTAQWTDLPFEEMCKKAASWGYDGIELATWGDHLELEKGAKDDAYIKSRKDILKKNNLGWWAVGAHIIGQCVGDEYDPRTDAFAPEELAGKPDKIREWAIQGMKYAAQAARNMGVTVVTGFMGSPIWKYWYSFPPTTPQMIDDGYKKIRDLWTPIFDEFDKQGVKFALEVHPTEIAYDVYSMHRLLEEFDHRETLGINFDPSHLIWQGMESNLFIREFADRIYHVHMKDSAVTLDGKAGILGSHLPFGDVRRGWNFRSIGHGDVSFEDIIRELNSIGYEGPLSVEWEDNGMNREFGAAESCEYVKKVNFSPSDVAFDPQQRRGE